ncbi:MAG: metabolite traffic protein EboE [Rhodothermales bacterium]|nr:metabolite traffic protein EboE [Rhodothermales bacterium]
MRVGPDGSAHLTYCTNVHPGETWAETFAQLERHVPALKTQLAPRAPFGIGLRLSARAAGELAAGDRLARFRDWLDDGGLYVFTLNGFPYGGFHGQAVKDRVHAPDWRTPERRAYTLRLADLLAGLLPDGVEGSISTSPVSYKPWLETEAERDEASGTGGRQMAEVALALARLREETGRLIHLGIEPEPDGLIENAAETVAFFEGYLLPAGVPLLADGLGVGREEAEARLRRHVGVCYDTCHFAIEYEEPADVLDRFEKEGIRLSKVQLSAALATPIPADSAERAALARRLRPFAEPTYLHQTIARGPGDTLRRYPDLPAALADLPATDAEEWRVHFHVPLFAEAYHAADGALYATRPALVEALEAVRARRAAVHFEIETYTWDVLPPALRVDLLASIRREYAWALPFFDPS